MNNRAFFAIIAALSITLIAPAEAGGKKGGGHGGGGHGGGGGKTIIHNHVTANAYSRSEAKAQAKVVAIGVAGDIFKSVLGLHDTSPAVVINIKGSGPDARTLALEQAKIICVMSGRKIVRTRKNEYGIECVAVATAEPLK